MFGYLIGFIPPVAWFVENYIDLILLAAVGGTALVTLWHYFSERRKVRKEQAAGVAPEASSRSPTTRPPDQEALPDRAARAFSTLALSAAMRSMTSPPASSRLLTERLGRVERVALLELGVDEGAQLLLVLVDELLGIEVAEKLSTRDADSSSSLSEIFTGSSRAGTRPRAPRRPTAASAARARRPHPQRRQRVFCRSEKRTIAVRSVCSRVWRSSTYAFGDDESGSR
jgi:hypothetical protein